jgi:hypothetical protein
MVTFIYTRHIMVRENIFRELFSASDIHKECGRLAEGFFKSVNARME